MKTFNINADCNPAVHYMVDIRSRLEAIGQMVDQGQYFTINRARQYGKTTTLHALEKYLQRDYTVINLDFQLLSSADFENEHTFVEAFSGEILDSVSDTDSLPAEIENRLKQFAGGRLENARLSRLFRCLSRWCDLSERRIVLMIDEIDSAANNQVFLDFLTQLRGYYIQKKKAAFHSVILTGVYDIQNMKRKFVTNDGHTANSPLNIAADFLVDMNFSTEDIRGMLDEYEQDYQTGMDTEKIAGLLYDYTSGYPFLVSKLCKILDEQTAGRPGFPDKRSVWTKRGISKAVELLLAEKIPLFESVIGKLRDYPELKSTLHALLFYGQNIVYNPDDSLIDMALMFGFVKIVENRVVLANRIFETRVYNYFLTTTDMQNTDLYRAALQNKSRFILGGRLNMQLILEKFTAHFDELYGERDKTFYEEEGRKLFLLYLKPIINGGGNYYIESHTRDTERTALIVDYGGEQFIVELKVRRGNASHTRGEEELLHYLEYYHLRKGYMLSFNYDQKKETGVKEIRLDDYTLIEAEV